MNGGDGDLLGGEWRRLPRYGGGLGLLPPRPPPPRWSRYLWGRDEPSGGGGGGGGERLRFRLAAGGPTGGGGGSCGERSSGLSGGGGGGRRARGASEAGSSTSAIRAVGLGFGAESSRAVGDGKPGEPILHESTRRWQVRRNRAGAGDGGV